MERRILKKTYPGPRRIIVETDPGNYLFAWTEAFEWIEHGLHRRHAARIDREPATMEAAKQPAALPDAVEAVERLVETGRATRGHPSQLDFGFPCPTDRLGASTATPGLDPLAELGCWIKPVPTTRKIHAAFCKSCPKCGGAVFGQWRSLKLAPS